MSRERSRPSSRRCCGQRAAITTWCCGRSSLRDARRHWHFGMPPWRIGIMHKLPRAFYDRDAISVARDLLGKCLVHRSEDVERVARIVEVEAYLGPHDLAAHSA